MVKWPIIPITIGQGPISRLCPIFDDGQKENEMQKNKAKKKGRKRAGNQFGKAIAEKRSKFWLLLMQAQITILHIFVPTLGEIYLVGMKIAFSAKLRPI